MLSRPDLMRQSELVLPDFHKTILEKDLDKLQKYLFIEIYILDF